MSEKTGTGENRGGRPDNDPLPLGVLDNLVGYHLRRSSAAFSIDFNRVIGDLGLRQVPFAVLTMIARHPGINQGAIGRALGIQRANMVALVGDLLERGLIERSEAVEDRRAFALTVSAEGDRLMRDGLARIEEHEQRMLADFTDVERQILITLLSRFENKDD